MITILSLFLLVCVAAQDNSQGRFTVPPPTGAIHDYSQNPVYHVGDFLDIQWNCTWKSVDLVLWQNGNPDYESLLSDEPNSGGLSRWQIKTMHNYTAQTDDNGTVFFFQLSIPGQSTAFGSHYFNLSAPIPTGGNNSTASTSQNSQTASPTVSFGPSSSSSVNISNNSMSTSLGLAAGLGIGVGITAAAFLGVLAYIFYRRHRRSKKKQAGVMPGYGPGVGPAGHFVQPQPQRSMTPVEISEQRPSIEFFHGAQRVHEVSQDQYQERGVRRISGVFEMPDRLSIGHGSSHDGSSVQDIDTEDGGPAGMIGLEGNISEAVEQLSPRTRYVSMATVKTTVPSSTMTAAATAAVGPGGGLVTKPGPTMVVRELNPGRWSQYMPTAPS